MEKKKKMMPLLIGVGVGLVLFWSIYSFFFYQVYQEAAVFATEGAQPIVQILEILNYRADVLLPFFIIFFMLVSTSLFYIMYLFLILKQTTSNYIPLVVVSLIIFLFIGFNVINKLGLFLGLLVVIAILIMTSIALTVKHLYIEKTDYEAGDIVRKKGPFDKLSEAHLYEEREIKKMNKLSWTEGLVINSIIYLEENKGHYVEIFLEDSTK